MYYNIRSLNETTHYFRLNACGLYRTCIIIYCNVRINAISILLRCLISFTMSVDCSIRVDVFNYLTTSLYIMNITINRCVYHNLYIILANRTYTINLSGARLQRPILVNYHVNIAVLIVIYDCNSVLLCIICYYYCIYIYYIYNSILTIRRYYGGCSRIESKQKKQVPISRYIIK